MSHLDALEMELAALRPREPSAELKRRIANRLAAKLPSRGTSSYWAGGAFVGGLLAASLAAVVAWQGGGPNTAAEPVVAQSTDFTAAFDSSLPSLWAYHRAVTQQPESLDSLLDRHARRSLKPRSVAPALAFARSTFDLDALNGEL